MHSSILASILVLIIAASAFAQAGIVPPSPPTAESADTSADSPVSPSAAFEEQVVVSASRVEQQLVDAPAAVTVITSQTLQRSPATNIGELLRAVPGVNVTQVSARDVNLNSRGATGTLATSQLALVDGRSIYVDFYGMVMWEFVPSDPREIKQIEVIRGPASAVWGANAMSGVVNVVTKSPRELAAEGGSSLTVGLGGFPRSAQGVRRGAGQLFYVNGSHAEAVNSRVAYKVSAGYVMQDAMPRPVGVIPNGMGTPYPAFANAGTAQPRFDARVDYALANDAVLSVTGGVAGTEGIIHTGIGPFDIDRGSRMTYLSTRFQRAAPRVAFITNKLTADSTNLLSRGATGAFLPLAFDTKTFDVDAGDTRVVAVRHALTFGGNYRYNRFDVSLAPNGRNRNEGGAYVQDEYFLHDRVRWVVGGRVDKFSSIEHAVFSPRTTLMLKPSVRQTVRLSFNRAFRAPSLINNHLETTVLNEVNLGAISPRLSSFVLPAGAVGNPALDQETLTAYELGYTGIIGGRATVTASVYRNRTANAIYFTQAGRYTPANPPPGWPSAIPTAALALVPPPGLPSLFAFRNLGTVTDRGLELGIDGAVNGYASAYVNYSYQGNPVVDGVDPGEVNRPARNRFNAGVNLSYARAVGNVGVSYTSRAFWQDVLDARFAGSTAAYTLVNGAFGVRWLGERVVTSLKVTNIGNAEVQQHVFGDIVRRQAIGEVRWTF